MPTTRSDITAATLTNVASDKAKRRAVTAADAGKGTPVVVPRLRGYNGDLPQHPSHRGGDTALFLQS
jgi:hypothetical protein